MSMLAKLKQWGDNLVRQATPVDPARFNDPVALKAAWTPLVPGGASFRTHRLTEGGPSVLKFDKSLGYVLFGLTFLSIGLVTFGIGVANGPWFLLLFGVPFSAVGVGVLLPRAIRFDGERRQFSSRRGEFAFSAIHALQLVKEHCKGDESSYWSYELNLVLQDGQRVNVIDHGDLPALRVDAGRISALIGCPLWNAT